MHIRLMPTVLASLTLIQGAWSISQVGLSSDLESPALPTPTSLVHLSGFLKYSGSLTSGEAFENDAGEQLSNVIPLTIRLGASGSIGTTQYKLGLEGSSGNASIIDAYLKLPLGDGKQITVGQFRAPVLFSGLTAFPETLFARRGRQGVIWAQRDVGLQIEGDLTSSVGSTSPSRTRWYVAAQNGTDGAGERFLLYGRLRHQAFGPLVKHEGRHGVDAEPALTLGFAMAKDTSVSNAGLLAADLAATWGAWYLNAEVIGYDERFDLRTAPGGAFLEDQELADTTPASISLAYSWSNSLESALQYQIFDDLDNSWSTTVGLNYYTGPKSRVGAYWTQVDSSNDLVKGDRFELSAAVRF